MTDTCVVIRGTGNIQGRYGQYGAAAADTASGGGQWTNPWGWQLIPQIAYGFNKYVEKYNSSHDKMAAFVVSFDAATLCSETNINATQAVK